MSPVAGYRFATLSTRGLATKSATVAFIGNDSFTNEQLAFALKLKPEDETIPDFNSSKMNTDVTRLTDLYGSQGYVFADVQAQPRFLETPGMIDLVYKITEGKQYRVGEINVIIDGEYGVTKRTVVIKRLGLKPGDLLDTRELRNSEARLRRSQLFADGSPNSPGPPPKISVKPPELDAMEQHIRR